MNGWAVVVVEQLQVSWRCGARSSASAGSFIDEQKEPATQAKLLNNLLLRALAIHFWRQSSNWFSILG